MTTLKTHSVSTVAEAAEYLRAQGFRPMQRTIWVRGDFKATAFLSYEGDDVVNVTVREKVY